MSFSNLGLNDSILKAIDEQGYNTPTPIQQQAIPVILDKKDVLAAAQTGTGKTAGFTLPLLEILSSKASEKKPSIKVLILVPTRELAIQVAENIGAYSKYLPIKSAVIFGGVGFNPQKATLRKGVDIVIATPGRLLDHMNQKTINLSKVNFLVLDEADRMLDMGFIHDIKKVMVSIPKNRQTLLFSATFSKEIIELSKSLLNEPTLIEVAKKNSSSAQIKQVVHYVKKDKKRDLLAYLINDGKWEQVLVFTRTKHGANRLAEYLNRGFIKADAIHGNKSQGARTKALANFKAKKTKVLVATDIAARGIDIDNLPYVVNFELPNIPEDYVHRIGRTGRAGKVGVATSLVCSEEAQYLKDIEKLIGKDIEVMDVNEYTIASLGKAKTSNKKSSNQKRAKNSDSSRNDRNSSRNDDRSKRKSLETKDRNRDEKRSKTKDNRAKKNFSKPKNKKEDKENQYFKDAKSKYEGNSDWKKEKSKSSRSSRSDRSRRFTADSRPRRRASK